MTTLERVAIAPEVWRAYDALANDDDPVGATYSPPSLLIVRWLAFRPGSTPEVMAGAHCERLRHTRNRLVRLHRLGLVRSTPGGDGGPRWWLTTTGRAFVELIDRERVI